MVMRTKTKTKIQTSERERIEDNMWNNIYIYTPSSSVAAMVYRIPTPVQSSPAQCSQWV